MENNVEKVEAIRDSDGIRPQMVVAKALERMMIQAAKVSDKKTDLDMKKIDRAMALMDIGAENGFDANGLTTQLRDAIALATAREDTRALTRLMELSFKMFAETTNNIGDQIIKLTQTQIKLDAGNKGGVAKESLGEEDVKKLVIAALEDCVGE